MTVEPLSDERLAEIRAGLNGVTPGPWQRYDGYSEVTKVVRANGWLVSDVPWGRAGDGNAHRDAEFIARLDPQTVAALLSRLDKAEAGWQDISTAPKDGTEVLLFGISPYDGPVQDVGYWPEMGSAVWVWCYVFEPTHWRPLPPPPSES